MLPSNNLDDTIIAQNQQKISSNEKIKLHIDTIKYDGKPASDDAQIIKPRLQRDTASVEVTIAELYAKLCEGYTISPAVMNGGAKAENWIQQQ